MGRKRMEEDRGAYKGPGDRDNGKDENEIIYVKKIKMTKTVTSKIHEWTMIELRKRNRAREQNVYKTKGPDITDENYRHPILRSTDGKKLEEMDKEWEMIFDLEWNEDLNQDNGTKILRTPTRQNDEHREKSIHGSNAKRNRGVRKG
jgi:hypothetical protein